MRVQEGVRKTITEFELKATDADTKVRLLPPLLCCTCGLWEKWARVQREITWVSSLPAHTPPDNFKQRACGRPSLYINRWMTEQSKALAWEIHASSGISPRHVQQTCMQNFKKLPSELILALSLSKHGGFDLSLEVYAWHRWKWHFLLLLLGLTLGERWRQAELSESIQGHQLYHPVSFVQAEAITFTVVQPPRHGLIEHTSNGQHYHQATTFTMDDIHQNRISYSHDGSNSLKDRFAFTVSDGTNPFFIMEDGGKKVKGQREVRETTEIADRKLPPLTGGSWLLPLHRR